MSSALGTILGLRLGRNVDRLFLVQEEDRRIAGHGDSAALPRKYTYRCLDKIDAVLANQRGEGGRGAPTARSMAISGHVNGSVCFVQLMQPV